LRHSGCSVSGHLRVTGTPRRFRLGHQPGRSAASQDRRDLLGELAGRDVPVRRCGQRLLETLDARLGDAVQARPGLREQVRQGSLIPVQAAHAEDLDRGRPAERERRSPEKGEDAADHRGDRGDDPGCRQIPTSSLLTSLLLLVLVLLRLGGLLGRLAFVQPALGDEGCVYRCGQLAGEVLSVLVS
jgi:hypothetical protein